MKVWKACMAISVVVALSLPTFAGPLTRARSKENNSRSFLNGSFVIHYPSHLSRMAETVEELITESAPGIAAEIGLESLDTVGIYLIKDTGSYRDFHRGSLPEWSIAFSDLDNQILGIDAQAVLRQPKPLETVIRHELSHLLLYQRVRGVSCPRWFVEGLAMMQSKEWTFSDQWYLMSSVWRKRLPYLDELEGRFPDLTEEAALAYRLSYFAVDELLRDRPEDLVTLTAFIRELGDFDEAFLTTFGETPDDYSVRLHVLLQNRYRKIGTLIQSAPYWLVLAVLFIAAYLVKRIRSRRKVEEWEEG